MAGRLELLETLGEGGMATVFRARDQSLRRDVAVKVLFPHLAKRAEVVSRFHREARAAAALDHPNILRVIDVGGGPLSIAVDGLCDPPFLVLELVEGNSLDEIVRETGALLAESAAAVGVVACRALARAHAGGIIHRDIKPANLMLADAGRVVIADFGVAHVADEDSVITRTGALLGTPAFMSPEQASAEPLDPRSDLYSLGATLYRLSTGTMPFTGTTAKVVTSILTGEVTPVLRRNLAVGPDLASVIMKLMATSADDRYPDAHATELALTEVIEKSNLTVSQALADIAKRSKSVTLHVVERTLDRAELCADQGRVPTALGLADRALALDSKNARAERILETISSRRSMKPWLVAGAAIVVAAATVFFVVPEWFGRGGETVAGMAFMDTSEHATPDTELTTLDTELTTPVTTPGEPSGPEPSAVNEEQDSSNNPRENSIIENVGRDVKKPVPNNENRRARERAGRIEERSAKESAAREARESTKESTETDLTALATDSKSTTGRGAKSGSQSDGAKVATSDTSAVPATVESKPAMGSLTIVTSNWCDLEVDSKSMGTVHRRKTLSLAAGRHRIVCGQAATGMHETRTVRVTAAKTARVSFVRKVQVTIGIGDGATVGGKYYPRGSSFSTAPRRIGLTLKEGERTKKVHVDVAANCVVKGNPVRCVPK